MFVCTGNICRSPMAHMYMQKKLYDLNKENEFLISSCGINAIQGQSATGNAIEVMKKYDIDLTSHRATSIENSNILDCDLIIVLAHIHKIQILQIYPMLNNKIFTLKEYVNSEGNYKDIDDPWGLDIEIYTVTAKDIVENINKLLEIL